MILQLDRETTRKHYGYKMKLRALRKVLLRRSHFTVACGVKVYLSLIWFLCCGVDEAILNFSNLRREEPSHVFFDSQLSSMKELKTFQMSDSYRINEGRAWGKVCRVKAHGTLSYPPAFPAKIMFAMNLIWIWTGTSNHNRVYYSNELQSC